MSKDKKRVPTAIPHEIVDKRILGKNGKTEMQEQVKELVEKKSAEVAATSDHKDNAILSHIHVAANRGK